MGMKMYELYLILNVRGVYDYVILFFYVKYIFRKVFSINMNTDILHTNLRYIHIHTCTYIDTYKNMVHTYTHMHIHRYIHIYGTYIYTHAHT